MVQDAQREISAEVWHKCNTCKEITLREDFATNLNVCPACGHHDHLDAHRRLRLFLDNDSFVESDASLRSTDPLTFNDRHPYAERLQKLHQRLACHDALVAGQGLLQGLAVQVAAFNFAFLGGSMGAVVGEKISRVFRRAEANKQPVVIFTSSGGARMQEGLVSLLQMAKTCAALASLQEKRLPFISVLTNPTTGGVAASFAMQGDVNIAEPNALIGFAGPRVIQQTIREKLPAGFQRSEYLLAHGMIDMICQRRDLRETISKLLQALLYRQTTRR